jgi:hypothetical protein
MRLALPRREAVPVLWACFCQDWLNLSLALTSCWWGALVRARWTRAVEVRSAIHCQTALAHDWRQVFHLYHDILSPQALVMLIGELQRERRLGPQPARALEEAILSQANAAGGWKGAGV